MRLYKKARGITYSSCKYTKLDQRFSKKRPRNNESALDFLAKLKGCETLFERVNTDLVAVVSSSSLLFFWWQSPPSSFIVFKQKAPLLCRHIFILKSWYKVWSLSQACLVIILQTGYVKMWPFYLFYGRALTRKILWLAELDEDLLSYTNVV